MFLEQATDKVPTDLGVSLVLLTQSNTCTNVIGSLLLDEQLRGQLYSREVWIQNMIKEDLDHGIDINE